MSRSNRTAFPLSVELIHPQRSKPFHREHWIYEEKYDGWRIAAFKDGRDVRLVSRRGRDHTARFPGVAAAIAQLSPRRLTLDGEVCVFDAKLVSQFHLLGDDDTAELTTPPVFMAFDCLQLRGRDLRPLPLRDRRKALEDVAAGAELVYAARRLGPDGLAAWATVQERGYEGLVAKDERAPYTASTAWWKVKVRHEARFVVVGLELADGYPYSLLLAMARRRAPGLRRTCRVGRRATDDRGGACRRAAAPPIRDPVRRGHHRRRGFAASSRARRVAELRTRRAWRRWRRRVGNGAFLH